MAWWLQRHRKRCKVLIFDANNHFPRQDLFTAAWQAVPGNDRMDPPRRGWPDRTRLRGGPYSLQQQRRAPGLGGERHPGAGTGYPGARGRPVSGHGWCPVKAATFESQLIEHVHVIGDACIAGPMPKSASAAAAQARQCAAAIVTALGGHEPPGAELNTVCYSLLAPQEALAIRGQFVLQEDEIRAVRAASAEGSASAAATAREAALWYRQIRSSCFGS